ncbi:hypothetical protein VDGL01_09150 [Verticillium dahliae]
MLTANGPRAGVSFDGSQPKPLTPLSQYHTAISVTSSVPPGECGQVCFCIGRETQRPFAVRDAATVVIVITMIWSLNKMNPELELKLFISAHFPTIKFNIKISGVVPTNKPPQHGFQTCTGFKTVPSWEGY